MKDIRPLMVVSRWVSGDDLGRGDYECLTRRLIRRPRLPKSSPGNETHLLHCDHYHLWYNPTHGAVHQDGKAIYTAPENTLRVMGV